MFRIIESDIFTEHGFEDTPHIVAKYEEAPVYYRLSQRGNAMEIHVLAEGREGKLALRKASKEVIDMIGWAFPDIECVIAPIKQPSVYNLAKKVGFTDLGEHEFENGPASVMVICYE